MMTDLCEPISKASIPKNIRAFVVNTIKTLIEMKTQDHSVQNQSMLIVN